MTNPLSENKGHTVILNHLPEGLAEELCRLAEERGMSPSEFVQGLISRHIEACDDE